MAGEWNPASPEANDSGSVVELHGTALASDHSTPLRIGPRRFRPVWLLAGVALVGLAAGAAFLGYKGGQSAGYDIGRTAGYSAGETAGYSAGEDAGYLRGRTAGYGEGRTEGYADGRIDGYAEGSKEGRATGYQNGYANGRSDGYSAGSADGYSDGHVDGCLEVFQTVGTDTLADWDDVDGYSDPYYVDTVSQFTCY